MKKIGIVGGIGWLSTVDYYTEICRRSERQSIAGDRNHPPSTPEMSIESLDLSKAASLIGVDPDDESWSRFDEYHRSALRRLEASGADFALIASNTPHHLIAELQGGESEGAALQIGRIAQASFLRQFAGRPIVCLACTELPLAFPEWKTLESFVADGITYVNSSAVHIAAAFDLAVGRVGGNGRRLE